MRRAVVAVAALVLGAACPGRRADVDAGDAGVVVDAGVADAGAVDHGWLHVFDDHALFARGPVAIEDDFAVVVHTSTDDDPVHVRACVVTRINRAGDVVWSAPISGRGRCAVASNGTGLAVTLDSEFECDLTAGDAVVALGDREVGVVVLSATGDVVAASNAGSADGSFAPIAATPTGFVSVDRAIVNFQRALAVRRLDADGLVLHETIRPEFPASADQVVVGPDGTVVATLTREQTSSDAELPRSPSGFIDIPAVATADMEKLVVAFDDADLVKWAYSVTSDSIDSFSFGMAANDDEVLACGSTGHGTITSLLTGDVVATSSGATVARFRWDGSFVDVSSAGADGTLDACTFDGDGGIWAAWRQQEHGFRVVALGASEHVSDDVTKGAFGDPAGLVVADDAVYVAANVPASSDASRYITGADVVPGLAGDARVVFVRLDRSRLGF